MKKYLKIINVMCNCMDQNANKNINFKFEVLSSKT